MKGNIKRSSWFDIFQGYNQGTNISEGLTREYSIIVDDILYEQWNLGENSILAWSPSAQGMNILVTRHYRVAEYVGGFYHAAKERQVFVEALVAHDKLLSQDDLNHVANHLNVKPIHVELPFEPGKGLSLELITAMVRRYGITLVEDRAVTLLDVVGFSLASPLEQVAQLNSLSYSVNHAYSILTGTDLRVNFSRSTTGDGFYIWNRETGIESNVELYHLMHMILADNAIAREKSVNENIVPKLRAAFHVGSHYEFYQAEALSPTAVSYLVGEVTIDLARMIDSSLPGQVLVGDFNTPMRDEKTGEIEIIDTVTFVERSRQSMVRLKGLNLSGEYIDSIACYLTGPHDKESGFKIRQYDIPDKHNIIRKVFNAKINIHRNQSEPLYLGLIGEDLKHFEENISRDLHGG